MGDTTTQTTTRETTRDTRTTARAADVDWRVRGICRDEDPELFFPSGVTLEALTQTRQACALCATCPVIGQCLEWALTTPEPYGVWGGLSEQDRRAIRRSRSLLASKADRATPTATTAEPATPAAPVTPTAQPRRRRPRRAA